MTICPKCSYDRKPEDAGPDNECPKCGVIYAKYKPKVPSQPQAAAPQRPLCVAPNTLICSSCGELGRTTTQTRGHVAIEIILWLTFLVPGLIYSFWRLSTRRRVCRGCGNPSLIAVGTPVGSKLLRDLHPRVTIGSPAPGPR